MSVIVLRNPGIILYFRRTKHLIVSVSMANLQRICGFMYVVTLDFRLQRW